MRRNGRWKRGGIFILLLIAGVVWAVEGQESSPPEVDVLHLSLEEAINRALQANRTIADAVDDVSRSRFSLTAARADFELKIIPEVFLDLTGEDREAGGAVSLVKQLSTGTRVTVSPIVQKSGGEVETGLDVSLTQPLLRGVSPVYNLLGVHQADYFLRSTERELYLTQMNVVLSVVYAVYNVVRQREILGLHRASFDRSLGYAEAAAVKQKMGMATAIDVYRANIKLKQAESLLISSRDGYQDALDTLRILLAMPLDQAVEVSAPLSYSYLALDADETLEIAMERRIEIEQYGDMIANLEQQSRAAGHGLLPDVDLTVRYSSRGRNADLGESVRANTGSVEVGLATTGASSRTREKALFEQSKIAVNGARRLLELKRDEITREVRFALRLLQRTEENIAIHRDQIEQAKGKLELAKVKFSRGMADNFDLIEAESELRSAEINLVSAVIQYIEGQYHLKAAVGTLIERPGRTTS
ncbi:MAG: TolC family protein [Acidobacteriota bacterium]